MPVRVIPWFQAPPWLLIVSALAEEALWIQLGVMAPQLDHRVVVAAAVVLLVDRLRSLAAEEELVEAPQPPVVAVALAVLLGTRQ